jgi:hypothetical protein
MQIQIYFHPEIATIARVLLSMKVVSAHDPPPIYDSTRCIHPLSHDEPFTHLWLSNWAPPNYLGGAQSLSIQMNDCCNSMRATSNLSTVGHASYPIWVINWISIPPLARLVVVRLYRSWGWNWQSPPTERSSFLNSYAPTKRCVFPFIPLWTFGPSLPYRFLTKEQSRQLECERDMKILFVRYNSTDLICRVMTASDEHDHDVPVLALYKISNLRDRSTVPRVVDERRKKLKLCFNTNTKWTEAVGGWMKFCGS